jgi:hypothetical protein
LDEKIEADLIVERRGLPTFVIEIKSTDYVHEGHVQPVKKVAEKIRGARAVVLSKDKVSKKIDGVSCWRWQEGLREMGICVMEKT